MNLLTTNRLPAPLGELVFRGGLPGWAAYTLIGLSLVLIVFVYFREAMKLHPAQRLLMAGLRGLTIACIILLLRKPVIVTDKQSEKQRPVAVVVDNSQSMGQRDPRAEERDRLRLGIARGTFPADYGLALKPEDYAKLPTDEPTRAEVVMAAFGNGQLNLRERLRRKGPLQEFFFGAQLRGAGKDWDKAVTATEAHTAVLDSLHELLQRDENEMPAAVVLVTDGRDNASGVPWDDLGRAFARRQIPVHVYGVGGGNTGILQIKDIDLLETTLFVEDTVRVPVRWRCAGIPGSAEIEINVKLGDRVVATKRVKAKEGDDVSETLTFVPEKRDAAERKQELQTTVRVVGGREADKISKQVRVIESKVKVLYVETSPRWEFKFLMRTFQRDRRIDATFVLINADEKLAKGGPPFLPAFPTDRKDLFAYDILIIGDVDAGYFSAEQQKWIKDYVNNDLGGFMMIAGRRHAPASYVRKGKASPVAEVLPVELEVKDFPADDPRRPEEFVPKLSDLGRRDPEMSLADDPAESLRVWQKLPGWFWHYPVARLKPAAVSLLDHPKEEIEDNRTAAKGPKDRKIPMPLIARHYAGGGTAVFVASDETWRWRFNEGDKYFARFWGQLAYQVGLPHLLRGKSQLMLNSDPVKGRETRVYARLLTRDHQPLQVKSVAGTLEFLDAKKPEERSEPITFDPVPDQPGMYVATFTKSSEGNYNLRLSDGTAESASLDFRVPLPPDDELAPGNLNEGPLRKLAEQTGGQFHREETLANLPDAVVAKTVKLDPPPRVEVLVWNRWWAFLIVISLFTAEWLVRKFSNLS
jgi:hypothetical protein